MSIEGDAIRYYRKQRTMTLRSLSEKTGYAMTTLSAMESGLQSIKVESLRKLASALDVSPADLLDETPSVRWIICGYCEGKGVVEGSAQVLGEPDLVQRRDERSWERGGFAPGPAGWEGEI